MKTNIFFQLIVSAIALTILTNCRNDNEELPSLHPVGKNRYTINIDGDIREYYVHIPVGYSDQNETPVVFMLHGTSGDGEKFYNISGWKEVGETENIITVFPSSWHHRISEEGGPFKLTTKWNVYPGSFIYDAGEVPRDDIHFLKEIIKELDQNFNVDPKRLYMVGFSNGGSMAFRCAVEMSNVFAAVVEASGTIQVDTLLTPQRLLPILFQSGNSDDKFLRNSPDVPLISIDSLLESPGLKPIMNTHINSFGLDSAFTTAIHDRVLATGYYTSGPGNLVGNYLLFVLVEGLEHNYPNGVNHSLKGAEEHWKWLNQFVLP